MSTKTSFGATLMALTVCAVVLFSAGRAIALAQDVVVVARDAWARPPLPSKTETAVYVVLENHGAERRAVVAASSDIAEKVEMHEMKMERMMMRMTPIDRIVIPAKGKASLGPNGMHLMLFGLKMRPAVGDSLNVTLTLDDGTTVPVTATVRK